LTDLILKLKVEGLCNTEENFYNGQVFLKLESIGFYFCFFFSNCSLILKSTRLFSMTKSYCIMSKPNFISECCYKQDGVK